MADQENEKQDNAETKETAAPSTSIEAIESVLGIDNTKEEDPPKELDKEDAGTGEEAKENGSDKPDATDGAASEDVKDGGSVDTASDGAAHNDNEVLYKIPKGMKGEHRKSFKALSDHALDLKSKYTSLETESNKYKESHEALTGFREILSESSASPQQLGDAFMVISAINSGDYNKALELIEAERGRLYLLAGKVAPGSDSLSEHKDLMTEVDEGLLSRERAEEIALGRSRSKLFDQASQQRRDEAATQADARSAANAEAEERQKAIDDVAKFVEEKKKTDIDIVWKEPIVAAKMKEILSGVPPRLWASQVKTAYSLLESSQRPQNKDPTPLRSKSSSATERAPKNQLEALQFGLGYVD